MRKTLLTILSAGSALALSGCGNPLITDTSPQDTAPDGRGGGTLTNPMPERHHGGGCTNGICYHGGPVILGTTNVHYIYYGNFQADKTVLEGFARSEGGSPYYNINTTYSNGAGQHVSNSIALAGTATDSGSQGTSLNDAGVQAVVAAQNPTDTNGVYFVLTAPNVRETSGFCSQYCGWHTHASINGRDIKYAFVGDPTACPNACEMQTTGPNGSTGADGMVSIIAHELEESASDPDLNAWYDATGAENADKCAWTFGSEFAAPNGATANMTLAGKDYLVQQNWVNASGGYCSMSF